MSNKRVLLSPATLICLLLLAPIGRATATTYCVDTPALLESTLLQVGNSSAENEIRIVMGTYETDGFNLSMSDPTAGDLTISGGWPAGCAAPPSNDARDTVLAGAITQTFGLLGTRRIDLRALTFFKFALVRARRKGLAGGHDILWDGVQLRLVRAIEVGSQSAGAIDLRNLLVHDSGTVGGDCMLAIGQDQNDEFSTTLLAQSTFALNKGAKQVCLNGVETSKLLRNNIFDGDAAQQSVFVANTQATLQHNRIQLLGGLPPSADSIDNFTSAPGFVDSALRDFRLAAGSPAINRGYMVLPEGQRAFDHFGMTRWNGFRPDLGALETDTVESSVFTVTNSNDIGAGSLRQAIENANANFDPSIVQFNIPDGCNSRILLNSELPMLVAPLWVNGYSQPGSVRNSSNAAFNATLCVGLVAGQFGFAHAFRTQVGGAPMRIEGIAFGGFGAASGNNAVLAISEARESVVRGNQFGGSSGFGLLTPSNADISISGAAQDVQVGGPQSAERNLFTSTLEAPNITIAGLVRNSQVLGNWFGLDRDGVFHMGTVIGVLIEGKDTIVRNNLFAYDDIGIMFSSSLSQHNRVQNNSFGLDPSGANAEMISAISARGGKNNIIGAIADQNSGGNLIANSLGAAIEVTMSPGNTPLSTRIRGNRIRATANGMDIDLAGGGPTANDIGDLDEGPNRTMNHPVLSAVSDAFGQITVPGTIDTLAGSVVIDFYASASRGTSERGEAAQYLGHVTTATGNFQFQIPLTVNNPYPYISATATNDDGNTSELSPSLRAPPLFVAGFE